MWERSNCHIGDSLKEDAWGLPGATAYEQKLLVDISLLGKGCMDLKHPPAAITRGEVCNTDLDLEKNGESIL